MVQYKNCFNLHEEFAFNSNMLSLCIHKRAAFDYEKEMRALLMSPVGETHSHSNVAVIIDLSSLLNPFGYDPARPIGSVGPLRHSLGSTAWV